MNISADTRKALKIFELTGYEIQAYTVLLEKGSLNANKISKEAGIPSSKIYEVLGGLEKKGWIEKEQGRPILYYPKPPIEAIETTKLRIVNLLKTSEEKILEDLQAIYERKENREKPDIWIVRGEFNILARIREICSRAREGLLIAIPDIINIPLNVFEPSFDKIKQRGISVNILLTRTTDPLLVVILKKWGQVRLKNQMFGGGVISDSKEVLLILGGEKDSHSPLAIWSNHISLVKFARNYFEYLWNETQE